MPVNAVTIGTGGTYETWADFIAETDPGTPYDWEVTLLANQDHIVSSTQAINLGGWANQATSVKFTSQGFTGKPYGTSGGNTSRLNFNYSGQKKLRFTSANCGSLSSILFEDIQIDIGNSNGQSIYLIEATNAAGLDLTFNRCVLSGMENTSNHASVRYMGTDYGPFGMFTVTNCLFTGNNLTGTTNSLFRIRDTGSIDGWRLHNNTFTNNVVTGTDVTLMYAPSSQSALDSKFEVSNNIIDSVGCITWDPEVAQYGIKNNNYATGVPSLSEGLTKDQRISYEYLRVINFTNGNFNGNYYWNPNEGWIDNTDKFQYNDTNSNWYRQKTSSTWEWISYSNVVGNEGWYAGVTTKDPATWTDGTTCGTFQKEFFAAFDAADLKNDHTAPISVNTAWFTGGSNYYQDISVGDITALETSPANNAGLLPSDTGIQALLATDIFGQTRAININGGDLEIDAGASAYETVAPPANTTLDVEDSLVEARSSGAPTVEAPPTILNVEDSLVEAREEGVALVIPPNGTLLPEDMLSEARSDAVATVVPDEDRWCISCQMPAQALSEATATVSGGQATEIQAEDSLVEARSQATAVIVSNVVDTELLPDPMLAEARSGESVTVFIADPPTQLSVEDMNPQARSASFPFIALPGPGTGTCIACEMPAQARSEATAVIEQGSFKPISAEESLVEARQSAVVSIAEPAPTQLITDELLVKARSSADAIIIVGESVAQISMVLPAIQQSTQVVVGAGDASILNILPSMQQLAKIGGEEKDCSRLRVYSISRSQRKYIIPTYDME